jgi:peroxiredoxin Q/BCP
LLSDTDRSVGSAYQAERDDDFADFPKRISYLIDPAGIIQKGYEVSDPAGHALVVLADLAALQR